MTDKESEIHCAYDDLRRALQTLDNNGEDLHLVGRHLDGSFVGGQTPQFVAGRSATLARIDGEWKSTEIRREDTQYGATVSDHEAAESAKDKEPELLAELSEAIATSSLKWIHVAAGGKKNFPHWETRIPNGDKYEWQSLFVYREVFRLRNARNAGVGKNTDYTSATVAVRAVEVMANQTAD